MSRCPGSEVAHCGLGILGVCYQYQRPQGIPVKMFRMVPVLVAVLVTFSANSAAAQAQATAVGCNWHCYRVALPLGLAIREVIDDGSFVTLEDGSVWEIRLSQRPVASSWKPGDFVRLKTIWAPVNGFEILLAHGDSDRAEARLAGRGSPPDSRLD